MTATTQHPRRTRAASCDDGWTPVHVTRSLLGWGVVAGPFYVLSSVAQGVLREGFRFTTHQWSLLENGDLGWVQVATFLLTGAMLVAFAVGLRRALLPGPASRWAPILVALFGVSLIAAGVFTADPALGFPIGTPPGAAAITTHGIVHFAAAGVGFICVAAACLVVAQRQSADGQRGRTAFSRMTAIALLCGFLCVASGAGSVTANLAFTGAVVLVFAWIAALAVDLYGSLATAAQPVR